MRLVTVQELFFLEFDDDGKHLRGSECRAKLARTMTLYDSIIYVG